MGNKVSAKQIAEFLQAELFGDDLTISSVSSINNPANYSLLFSKHNSISIPENFQCLVIAPKQFKSEANNLSYIKVENPRLDFAKVLSEFFQNKAKAGVSDSSKVGRNCKIDQTASIGNFCVIGNNVQIGKNTVINHSVIIGDNAIIGDYCYIKSGAIIGEDGFGFEFNEDNIPVRIPHIGNVIIGNNVEIGAHSVIARGTIESTVVEDNVKIDDQVFIAHNCRIGENSLLIAFAEVSGSVDIGKNCWIAPNCTIINKVKIGDNVVVGIGALVTKDIPSNKKVMGLEAIDLKSLKKFKQRSNYYGTDQ